ncbi:hypothetical protein ABIB40_004215 [Pedobacter sp. UYP30]|uniref:DUF2806 domain-containing protein n=1 Tax=Pedobacter sp. UYP30 TaxID=1756400 RepID=UPI003396C8B3
MTELENQDGSSFPSTSDILSYIDHIPLPPGIKKSLWKSVGRLITGLVDVPVAYLEAKVQQIRTEANALTLVTKNASDAAAKEFGQDQYLIDRTVNHFGSKLLREQINREKTVQLALDDLKANKPKEDSKNEIDPDWLELFSRIAETKSNEDVQLFLSKILSGEIRKPGTFSPKTIQTLSLLDQNTAAIFQSFCNISFEMPELGDGMTCVFPDPLGSPGNNGLSSIGLSYSELTQLQDAGLIQYDLNAWREIPPQLLKMPFTIGDKLYTLKLTADTPRELIRVAIINFTKVGLELRKVIHSSHNLKYNAKFEEWVISKFKLNS